MYGSLSKTFRLCKIREKTGKVNLCIFNNAHTSKRNFLGLQVPANMFCKVILYQYKDETRDIRTYIAESEYGQCIIVKHHYDNDTSLVSLGIGNVDIFKFQFSTF